MRFTISGPCVSTHPALGRLRFLRRTGIALVNLNSISVIK